MSRPRGIVDAGKHLELNMRNEVIELPHIGPYQILGKIAESAHHELLEARSLHDQSLVAVKLCRRNGDYSLSRSRFERELQVSRQLTNSHAVRVIEIGSIEHARPYLVMELLVGSSVAEWIHKAGPISEQDTISVLSEVCEYLVELHRMGFVHCDLKPQNLFELSEPLGQSQIKVLDLGIGRSLHEPPPLLLKNISGSPHYMSPEAIQSPDKIDTRSDIYSLGCSAFHMVTGTTPYAGNNPLQICSMHLKQQPRSLEEFNCQVSQTLQSLILQCMNKNPDERPASSIDLLEVLSELRS